MHSMLKRAAIVASLAASYVALAGCGDDDASRAPADQGQPDITTVAQPPTTTQAPPATPPPATTEAKAAPAPVSPPPASSRCRLVSAAALAQIADGLEYGPKRLTKGYSVRSRDYARVFMIAARFRVDGVDEAQIGVWARNGSPNGPGLILSVNGFAKEFSVWPDADRTDAGISALDDGVEEAQTCAEQGRP